MPQKDAKEIIDRYNTGTATEEEKILVERWYAQQTDEAIDISEDRVNFLRDEVFQLLPHHPKIRRVNLWPRIAAAAVILVFLSFGAWFMLLKNQVPTALVAQKPAQDIPPGGNRATITLADGRTLSLDNAKNGQLATQGNAVVAKTADGDVIYKATNNADDKITYNTMSVPRGGQYHLTLADGTNVWLNAASSIRYPTAFTGSERKVEVTGEAYFEVAHNKAKPFRVVSNGQLVEVLGTHFNVRAYSDEPSVKTTLLEGSVMVLAGASPEIIKPGQQSVLVDNSLSVREVDTEEVTAWKDGMFRFSDARLKDIMQELSRWYDVEIEYRDKEAKNLVFSNVILTHFNHASKVLHMLELTNQVHFEIKGKKIIVMK